MEQLIGTAGLLGIALIVFFESGFPFAFWLPGDSLLLSVGLLAAGGRFEIVQLLSALFCASVTGVAAGYWTGRMVGTRFLDPEQGTARRRKRLRAAQSFYIKHGGKALVLGRFMPAVRSFIPFFAGIARMPHRRLMFYNIVGGALWATGLPLVGYYGGAALHRRGIDLDAYILPVVGGIVAVFIIVPIVQSLRDPEARANLFRRLR